MLRHNLVIGFTLFGMCGAFAQAPQPLPEPNDAARALVGGWELSNPDRDRRCQITFRLDPAPPGRAPTLSSACAAAFPYLRATDAWQLARDDALRPVDSRAPCCSS